MLEQEFRFDDDAKGDYNLVLRRCVGWSSSPRRLLIVVQHIDSRDLKAQALMSCPATESVIKNSIKYARTSIARPYAEDQDKAVPPFAYCIANFNASKHMHLKKQARRDKEDEFAKRIHKLIKKIKPTHVLVAGNDAFHAMYPQVENSQYKNGWIHNFSFKDSQGDQHKIKVCQTLDVYRMLDKSSEFANLLGFYCRHLAYLMLGKNPHDLSDMQVNPKYIKTIEQFDQLIERWKQASEVAVDTETKNLSVLHNRLYTIQFAFDTKPDTGYVLTVDHPLGHWSKAERKYIKSKLKEIFSESNEKQLKLLLTFNGMFDLRIIRRQLKIPIIWHRVWEITAGEHLLDENIGLLSQFLKGKHGGLAPILCSYLNDAYFTDEFKKEDRATIGAIKPTNKGFQKYAAQDVVALLAMKKQQIKRASMIDIEGLNYKKPFIRHMLYQMSDTAHQLSHLREDGSYVSMKYLTFLMEQESPLKQELQRLLAEFKQYPEVKEANDKLVGGSGFKAKGFAALASMKNKVRSVSSWTFKLTKSAHKKVLFIDTLGLEPLEKTKTGEPQIDKAFVKHYKDKNKVLQAYASIQEIEKLLSTYIKGWYKKLSRNLDSLTDFHLRPDYSFWDVVTGRLASRNPSLQTIPQRSKIAKYIKRMFETEKGYLLVRYDYSAHEVRIWAVSAGDKVLASVFRMGQTLRKKLIQCLTPEDRAKVKEELKRDGDVHILNVKRLFNKVVDKSHPLRDAIKAVIFGLLYGKSARTLGEDTKLADLNAFKAQISTLYDEQLRTERGEEVKDKDGNVRKLKTIQKELVETERKLAKLLAEDREDYAQDIIDKLFNEFRKGAAWTRKMMKMAEEKYYVYSPIFRRRFLPAAMIQDRGIINEQVRRGSNGPIQGFASEIGIKASRVFMEDYYRHAPKLCKMLGIKYLAWRFRVMFNRVVHDASYISVPYAMILPFIHILQWGATYGVTKKYLDEFGIKFEIEPEIELEVAARDDKSYKWSFVIPELIENLEKTCADADEIGQLEGTPDEVMDIILEPWRNTKVRNYLQKHFPLLGVEDLDAQIQQALDEYDSRRAAKVKEAKREAKKAISRAKQRSKSVAS